MKITRHMLSTLKVLVHTVPWLLLLLLFFFFLGQFLQIRPPCPHVASWGKRENFRKILKIYSMVKIMSLMIRSHVLSQRRSFGGVFIEYSAGSGPPCLCPTISNPESLTSPRHLQRKRTGSSHLNPISSKYVIRAVHLGSLFLPFKS